MKSSSQNASTSGILSFPIISISGVFSQRSHIHITLCLLSRRRSRRGRISSIALISTLRMLDSGLLAIVAVVGVECVAGVLRLLLLAVRRRRSVALIVAALVVTLVIATLVTVVVHLVVVVVLSPGLASHPAGTVDGLSATALTTARDALQRLTCSSVIDEVSMMVMNTYRQHMKKRTKKKITMPAKTQRPQ